MNTNLQDEYQQYLLECKKEKAEHILNAAMEAAKMGRNDKNLIFAETMIGKFDIYIDVGKCNKLHDLSEAFLRYVIYQLNENCHFIRIPQSNSALHYKEFNSFNKLKTQLETALKNNSFSFDENRFDKTDIQTNLALVYQELEEHENAKDILENAIQSNLIALGEKHEKVALRRFYLASIFLEIGAYKKARDLLLLSLESNIENYAIDHPVVFKDNMFLALTYSKLKDYKQAFFFWEKRCWIHENHPYKALQFLVLFYISNTKKDNNYSHLNHRSLLLTSTHCAKAMNECSTWKTLNPVLSEVFSELISTSMEQRDRVR